MADQRVIGLNMSVEQTSRAVLRLCHFAPMGSGSFARDLLEFIVEIALSTQGQGRYTTSQIRAFVHDLLPLEFEYEEILEAVRRLVMQNRLFATAEAIVDSDTRFGLEARRRVELENQVRHSEAIHRKNVDKWLRALEEKYPYLTSSDLDCLRADLLAYLVNLISFHGAECVDLIYEDSEAVSELLGSNGTQLFTILPARPSHLEQVRQIELPEFFRDASADRKAYIGSLLDSAFLLHMLQLDPECSAIVRAQLAGGTIYLDTNLVYRLLGLQGPELFLAAKRLVEISHELGYELVVSPLTIDEFKESLRRNASRLPHIPMLTEDMLEVAVTADTEEDFVKAYLRRKRSAWVSPETFVEYYRQVDGLLRDEYGIPIAEEPFKSTVIDPEELLNQISLLSRSVEDFKKDRYGDDIDLRLPHEEVLRHDAYHRLFILSLRGQEPKSFTETPYWFLTCDSKLPRYDRLARKGRPGVPFCALSGQWLQVLRPFLPRHADFEEVLACCLSSPFLGAFRTLPGDAVRDILGRIAMIKPSLPAVAARIVANRQFVEQFAEAESDEIKHELIENEIASIAEEYEGHIVQLSTRVDEIQDEKAVLEQDAVELRERLEALRVESAQEAKALRDIIRQSEADARSLREEHATQQVGWQHEQNRVAKRLESLEIQLTDLADTNKQLFSIKQQRDRIVTALKWSVPMISGIAASVGLAVWQPWTRFAQPWGIVTTLLIGIAWLVTFMIPLGSNRILAVVGGIAAVAEVLSAVVGFLAGD
jgi:hypothetical protein